MSSELVKQATDTIKNIVQQAKLTVSKALGSNISKRSKKHICESIFQSVPTDEKSIERKTRPKYDDIETQIIVNKGILRTNSLAESQFNSERDPSPANQISYATRSKSKMKRIRETISTETKLDAIKHYIIQKIQQDTTYKDWCKDHKSIKPGTLRNVTKWLNKLVESHPETRDIKDLNCKSLLQFVKKLDPLQANHIFNTRVKTSPLLERSVLRYVGEVQAKGMCPTDKVFLCHC